MVTRVNEQTIEVTLPNKIGYERIAMACSASFAKILGFVPERIEDLKTAVSEACLNAVEHGNKGHPDARVVVTLDFKDDAIKAAQDTATTVSLATHFNIIVFLAINHFVIKS